jgi:hypothetical protein
VDGICKSGTCFTAPFSRPKLNGEPYLGPARGELSEDSFGQSSLVILAQGGAFEL